MSLDARTQEKQILMQVDFPYAYHAFKRILSSRALYKLVIT